MKHPPTPLPTPNSALAVERVTVMHDRLVLLVRVSPDAPRYTTPELAQRVLVARPSLAHHTCVNDRGPTFADVIDRTSLPHMLEHLIIDEQVRHPSTLADATFVGTTEWLNETAGLARVEVNFADDLVALQSLQRALSFLNREVVG